MDLALEPLPDVLPIGRVVMPAPMKFPKGSVLREALELVAPPV
jgi:hypothetical protein